MKKLVINKNGVYFHLNLESLNLDPEILKEKGCKLVNSTTELVKASKEILGDHIEFSEDEDEVIENALTLQLKNGEYSLYSSYPSYIWDEEVETEIHEFLANYSL